MRKLKFEQVNEVARRSRMTRYVTQRIYQLISDGHSREEIRKMRFEHTLYVYNALWYIRFNVPPRPTFHESKERQPYWRSEQEMEIQVYNFEDLSESEQLIYNEL